MSEATETTKTEYSIHLGFGLDPASPIETKEPEPTNDAQSALYAVDSIAAALIESAADVKPSEAEFVAPSVEIDWVPALETEESYRLRTTHASYERS